MNCQSDSTDGTERMLALAERFQAEGQVNLSKLLEAAVYGRLHRRAWQSRPQVTVANMQAELDSALDSLKQDNFNPQLTSALESGSQMLAERRVPLIQDAPDIFVCRTCGYAAPGAAPDHCPDCGSWPGGFRKFIGTFNGDNTEPTNPMEMVKLLSINAEALKSLVAGLSQEEMNVRPSEDMWAIHNHVAHFRDANDTLETRVNLMLTRENPELVVLALYEMATQAAASSTTELLNDYLDRRGRFVAQMENLPLKDFWRPGWHQEFGHMTIVRQIAYMANHEQTHLPEIEALRNDLVAQR